MSETAEATGRREATKERNREAILSAGIEVFSDIGYGQATVRDLIRASGLATGTFYNYFPDKESVLRALVDRSAVELRAQLAESRAGAATAEEFVDSLESLEPSDSEQAEKITAAEMTTGNARRRNMHCTLLGLRVHFAQWLNGVRGLG